MERLKVILMSVVVIMALGTTAQATVTITGAGATQVIDIVPDGNAIQNGQDLYGAMISSVYWNATHTSQYSTTQVQTDGTIVLHAGTYDKGSLYMNWVTRSTIKAAGDGPVLIKGNNPVLMMSGYSPTVSGSKLLGNVSATPSSPITVQSLDWGSVIAADQASFTVKDVTLEGGYTQINASARWNDYWPNNWTLDNVTFNIPFPQTGLWFDEETATPITGWEVKNCHFNGGAYGIILRKAHDNTIIDNTTNNVVVSVVFREGSQGNLISDNAFVAIPWSVGIDSWSYASVYDNTISDNLILVSSSGINIQGDNTISGNDITAYGGISLSGPNSVLDITDNVLESTAGSCISAWNFAGATGDITGNTFLGAGSASAINLGYNAVSDLNVSYNTIDGLGVDYTLYLPPGTSKVFHNTILGKSNIWGNANVYDNLFVGTATGNAGANLHDNYTAANAAAVAFMSTDPNNAGYLYLSCDTPSAIVTGATGGTYFGAKPIGEVCCISGNEALLAACIAGRNLVMATTGWNQLRNPGEGYLTGRGVLLNMPLIAHVATAYVDSLDICNEADRDELHSCIVSYFASGGKSSHFGE